MPQRRGSQKRSSGQEQGAKSHTRSGARSTALLALLVVAVVTSVINLACNLLLWRTQRGSELREKLLDARIALIEAVSQHGMEYQELRRHRVIYSLLVKIETRQAAPHTIEEKVAIEERLKNRYPSHYQKSLESETLLPTLSAKLVMAQVFFGPKTKAAVRGLTELMEKEVDDYVSQYIDKKAKLGVPIEKLVTRASDGTYDVRSAALEIAKDIDARFLAALCGVVNAMYQELEIPWSERTS